MIPNLLARRFLVAVAALSSLAAVLAPLPAHAATRIFVAANELGEIWEITTAGTQVSSFPLIPQNPSTRPGLAFDGTELYYTDENLAVIQVYSQAGALNRTLPKPAGLEPGSGLGVSDTKLFLVGLDGIVTAIDKTTGLNPTTFAITGGSHGLTFAGSRNSLFVTVNDSATVKEVSLAGVVLHTLAIPAVVRGLGYSSSANVLYATRSGVLYAIDPDTGAAIGAPVQITGLSTLLKTGALATDEIVSEFCGDGELNTPGETCDPPGGQQPNGQTCREDCTYCGDATVDAGEQCDDGNTDNADDCRNDCTLPRCGDGIQDPNELCDDGNTADGDGCDANCQIEGECGDGIVQPQLGEQCEPPNTDVCDANCHPLEICLDLVDNDGDGQVDCLDPDCDCLPIGRDPGAIRFGRSGADDLFAVHGSLKPNSELNPVTDAISFLLTNANGEVFRIEMAADTAKRIGKNLFRFKDKRAQRNRSGLARFDLRYFPRRDNYTFVVKAYGDLEKATVPLMSVQLAIGDDGFLNTSTWAKSPAGWILSLPGE
jgi:cysteine-rich repeat protein